MYKYDMDPTNTVGASERTDTNWFYQNERDVVIHFVSNKGLCGRSLNMDIDI